MRERAQAALQRAAARADAAAKISVSTFHALRACRSCAPKRGRSASSRASRSSIRRTSSRSSPSSPRRPIARARARSSGRSASGRTRWSRPADALARGRATTTSSPQRAPMRGYADALARVPGGRLRRPDRAAGRAVRSRRRRARALAGALRARADRRVPGHEPGAVPAVPPSGRDEHAVHRRRRRRPGDLRLARRDARQPRRAAARLSGPARDQARAELPVDGAHPALRERADRQQPEAVRQAAVDRARARRSAARHAGRRRGSGSGLVVRRLLAHKFEHRQQVLATTRSSIAATTRRACSRRCCARRAIPYEISGGQSMFERTEIKDIVAYLRLIANEDDDPAFVRALAAPRRGVGQATLRHLGDVAQARHDEPVRAPCSSRRSRRRCLRGSARRSTQFCALDQRPAPSRGARARRAGCSTS